ncbi:hypothetical protein PR048_014799 [Dryococelus australis]|uniref:protein phosphatase methylesterase-1 n=1 Tax=Dryococelus australis TaxID=614101 RepID=A0ABQ9HF57_9NEOP|nr:hypothetical protein PR048_014799 [Dryococelus australis]
MSPTTWHKYFEESQDVAVNEADSFRIYKSGSSGPVLVLLHGGGFSALTWALFSASVTTMVECRVLAIDLRGHGDTVTSNDTDLSAETMARDVGAIVEAVYQSDLPPIVLIGHSMGGAIAVHTASAELIPSLIGLAVIDVVEGTAMDALASMQSFLHSRPSHFRSLEYAIEWCLKSSQVRNLESAKVSVPGQLKKYTDNAQVARKYTWRIDLAQTEQHWPGWFRGLSNLFLGCSVPKMLLLAGVDRLDRDLTVGQMQGKFQMQVLPQCGHAVHEDVPDKVAEVVASFLVRHKFAEAAASFNRDMEPFGPPMPLLDVISGKVELQDSGYGHFSTISAQSKGITWACCPPWMKDCSDTTFPNTDNTVDTDTLWHPLRDAADYILISSKPKKATTPLQISTLIVDTHCTEYSKGVTTQ